MNPYGPYFSRPNIMFPLSRQVSDRLPVKERVLGVWTRTAARAYPVSAFSKQRTSVTEEIGGHKVTVEFNPQTRSLRVAQAGDGVRWTYALWFAWYVFHPETDVFRQKVLQGQ